MSTIDDEDIVGGSDNEDDEIEVTAKEVFEKLLEAWLNEKLAPGLLETRIELVECMLAQVKELENSLSSKDKDLSTALQKIELERVKFVIASFLRERLKKVESNVVHVLEEEANGESPKLSPDELNFAKSFADNMEKHFNKLALQQMPSNMQTLEQKKNVPRPNLESYVFIKVNEKVDQVILDPEEDPVDLDPGSQHIETNSQIIEWGFFSDHFRIQIFKKCPEHQMLNAELSSIRMMPKKDLTMFTVDLTLRAQRDFFLKKIRFISKYISSALQNLAGK